MAQMLPGKQGRQDRDEVYGPRDTQHTGTLGGAVEKKQGFAAKAMNTFNAVKGKLSPSSASQGNAIPNEKSEKPNVEPVRIDTEENVPGPAYPTGGPPKHNVLENVTETVFHGTHESPTTSPDIELNSVATDTGAGTQPEKVGQQDGNPGAQQKPGLVNKLKDMITGQKPGHGTGTGHATTDTSEATTIVGPDASNPSEDIPLQEKEGATTTTSSGVPIEGPRDDTVKKEGVMEKLMGKLQLGNKENTGNPASKQPIATTPTS